jgi:hypothetical protein
MHVKCSDTLVTEHDHSMPRERVAVTRHPTNHDSGAGQHSVIVLSSCPRRRPARARRAASPTRGGSAPPAAEDRRPARRPPRSQLTLRASVSTNQRNVGAGRSAVESRQETMRAARCRT